MLVCRGVPEVCAADLTQDLNVFLTDAVRLSRQTAPGVLPLSPLALWKHAYFTELHSECDR